MRNRAHIAVLVLSFVLVPVVHAQSQRTFVSSTGNDANPCSRTAPCRNFPAAIAAVASGGEVVVLDSAGYGAFTVNSSVAITAPDGVYGGVTGFAGAAITINASGGTVALHGLTVNGLGADTGIDVSAVSSLHVENCALSSFTGNALHFAVTGGALYVVNTSARNTSNSGFGISANGGFVRATLDHCRSHENAYGVQASATSGGTTQLVIRDSLITRNLNGIVSSSADVNVKNCVVSYSTTAAQTFGTGSMSVGSSMFSNDTTVFSNCVTCFFQSFGNNEVTGGSNAGTITTTNLQ